MPRNCGRNVAGSIEVASDLTCRATVSESCTLEATDPKSFCSLSHDCGTMMLSLQHRATAPLLSLEGFLMVSEGWDLCVGRHHPTYRWMAPELGEGTAVQTKAWVRTVIGQQLTKLGP